MNWGYWIFGAGLVALILAAVYALWPKRKQIVEQLAGKAVEAVTDDAAFFERYASQGLQRAYEKIGKRIADEFGAEHEERLFRVIKKVAEEAAPPSTPTPAPKG